MARKKGEEKKPKVIITDEKWEPYAHYYKNISKDPYAHQYKTTKKSFKDTSVREQVYKEVRREKQSRILKRLVVNMGEMPLVLYILFSSLWITISSVYYVYYVAYHEINELFMIGGGGRFLSGFVFFGLMMFICWVGMGLFAVWIYKARLRLLAKGEKPVEGIISKLLK